MATNSHSYADLVSLYFEGVLSGEEKLAVYHSLSIAEEARLEFEAALFLQRTLDRDTLVTIPASVEHDLFRRAGIALPMEENKAPERKSMRVAILAFVLGALSVFSIDRLWSDTNHEAALTSDLPAAPERSAHTQFGSSRSILPVASMQETAAAEIPSNYQEGSYIREKIRRDHIATEDNDSPPLPLARNAARALTDTASVTESPIVRASDVAIAEPVSATQSIIIDNGARSSVLAGSNFEISLMHSNAPRYFPDRDVTARSILDNSAFAVRYQIASDHWLGVAAGADVLPLEISQGKSEVIVNALDWVGISYQLNIRSRELRMLYPFIRETIGMTKFGLLAKTGLGVRFSPNDIVHAALGLEHTTMPVRSSDVMRGTGKLSLAYDITIQF